MVQWMYGQKFEHYLTQAEADAIGKPLTHTQSQWDAVHTKLAKRQRHLIDLWILADRLEVPTLQNFITHELNAIRED
jgi:hypothetical protein